jgi:hypothetical protein
MRPHVRIVRDLPDAPATTRYLNRLHSLGRGVIVVRPTPGRGGPGIARDILTALGKRFRPGRGRAAERLLALATLWLHAERARHLVIARADTRPVREWSALRDLCDSERGPTLWLILHRQLLDPDQHTTLRATHCRELQADDLADWLQPAPAQRQGALLESGEFPPVADVDFPFFPSACVELLPEPAARVAIDAFREGRVRTFAWLKLHRVTRHGEIVAYLDSLAASHASLDAVLARLRGAQAALLIHGLLVRIDPRVLAARHDARVAAPTQATANRLRALLEPHLAAAGAIAALTGNDAELIGALRLRDVRRDAAELAGGHVIPPHLQALIRAQTLARHTTGATDDAPLFLTSAGRPANAHAISGWLDRVGRELDLNLTTGYGAQARYDRARLATVIDLRQRTTAASRQRRLVR